MFIYEQPKTGDLFTITDPDLQLDQLDAVQHQVAQLLEHGLYPVTEVSAAPAELPSSSEESSVPAVGNLN